MVNGGEDLGWVGSRFTLTRALALVALMAIDCYVDCKVLLYADDSALLVSGKDPKMVADELSKELDSCRQWMIDNKLSLHLGKTEAILFGSKRKLNSVQDFSVKCNGKTINNSSSVKYLGVNLDNTLSGESIASNIIKKASGRLKFLYRHSNCLNFKSRKTLSSALGAASKPNRRLTSGSVRFQAVVIV